MIRKPFYWPAAFAREDGNLHLPVNEYALKTMTYIHCVCFSFVLGSFVKSLSAREVNNSIKLFCGSQTCPRLFDTSSVVFRSKVLAQVTMTLGRCETKALKETNSSKKTQSSKLCRPRENMQSPSCCEETTELPIIFLLCAALRNANYSETLRKLIVKQQWRDTKIE